jgi:hypothetical protein
MSRFPVAFRLSAFAFWVILSPLGNWAFLAVGLPVLAGPDPIGIPRSTRMSCDRVGCPLDPGDGGALTADCSSPTATRRLSTAGPYPPGPASISGGCI